MTNRYFVCSRNRPPVEFDLAQDRPVDDAEITYFIRGFRILEETHEFDGYTVCFAWSSKVILPVLGGRVIALIYGDEHCRIPSYVNKVAAVIKCHGLFPTFVPRLRPARLVQIEAAEFLRNLALWMPSGWRWLISPSVRARCHLVPIGYGIPTTVEPVPIHERQYVTSFLGSVPGKPTGSRLRILIGTPKVFSRRSMMAALQRLETRLPRGQVRTGVTQGFQESLLDAGRIYSEVLSQTKICVAPRGTTHETWRIADGLKLGCVVISDLLPRHPFYKDCPIIQIEDWSTMPDLVQQLLADPKRLETLHEQGLSYWVSTLSEDALVRRFAQALRLQSRDEDRPTRRSQHVSTTAPS